MTFFTWRTISKSPSNSSPARDAAHLQPAMATGRLTPFAMASMCAGRPCQRSLSRQGADLKRARGRLGAGIRYGARSSSQGNGTKSREAEKLKQAIARNEVEIGMPQEAVDQISRQTQGKILDQRCQRDLRAMDLHPRIKDSFMCRQTLAQYGLDLLPQGRLAAKSSPGKRVVRIEVRQDDPTLSGQIVPRLLDIETQAIQRRALRLLGYGSRFNVGGRRRKRFVI